MYLVDLVETRYKIQVASFKPNLVSCLLVTRKKIQDTRYKIQDSSFILFKVMYSGSADAQ